MATSLIRFPILLLTALLAVAASGTASAVTVSGPHANEDFCRTMVVQLDLLERFLKLDPNSSDATARTKYFADAKAVNATLLKTAPPSLAGDVALQTRNADALLDAQASRDAARTSAAAAPLRSPEHRAASKRMSDYCGVQM